MGRYLITGGAGFIGSHLADALAGDGHTVRVLDNFSNGRIENLSADVDLIDGDVTSRDQVRRALIGVDACFHLAAVASVEFCRKKWLQGHVVNAGGAITVFDEVRRAQVHSGRHIPIVYASSAAVYGNTKECPISEAAYTQPTNAYGVDKLSCEWHAGIGSRLHDLAVVGLRFFNIYGPRQDPNSPYSGVVSVFCRKILDGEPVEIHGDGGQVRDFVYVADAVTALRQAVAAAVPQAPQVFNVCTGAGTQICELARCIAKICGVSFAPVYTKARQMDLRLSVGDPCEARRGLKFVAKTPLEAGLMQTLGAMGRR